MKKILLFSFLFYAVLAKAQNLDEMINFIKNNPQKTSIYLIEDDKVTVNRNSNQLMPLASAAKTIIAIEFAKQAAAQKFLPAKNIAVSELARYYIPNTDGGAHPEWLKSIKKKATDSVSLLEIAKGMIKFSSNANTEFLEDYLGLANINKNLESLDLQNHQPLYYFTASAIMTSLKPKNIDEKEWIAKLSSMPIATYRKKCEETHQKIKADPSFIKSFNFENLSMNIQKVWSDRLVASTTQTYATLMQRIGSGTYFDPAVQRILESILEWPMEYEGNKQQFKHLGQKGGSTSFILTDAFYAESKTGNKLACSFFFNNLTTEESLMVNKFFGAFEANILTSQKFRLYLSAALKPQ